MKNLISVVFVLLFTASMVSAQVAYDTYRASTPKTLTAGTSMSARTASTSMDDTTQAFSFRGYHAVYVGLESATNDTVHAYLAYQVSKDGVTYGSFILSDSLSTSGLVGASKYFQLPANALGAPYVRLRVYGNALTGAVSINPSPTLTTSVVKVLVNAEKQH